MKRERARHGVQLLKCVPASTVDCVWSQKRVIRPTQTSNLFTWDAHVREDTREDSVIAKLTPASSMASRVTQAQRALIFPRQPMSVDTRVDRVQLVTLEMERSVLVGVAIE